MIKGVSVVGGHEADKSYTVCMDRFANVRNMTLERAREKHFDHTCTLLRAVADGIPCNRSGE